MFVLSMIEKATLTKGKEILLYALELNWRK
jgi:hypothetical protein